MRRWIATPRRLIGVAVGLVALLPGLVGQATTIAPADAAAHEGQNVRTSGVVTAVYRYTDGQGTIHVARDGHAIAVRGTLPPELQRGTWVEAEGVLLRHDARLVLHADRLHAASPHGAARPDWPDLATSPDAWTGRLLVLAGHVERDAFGVGGHDVRTGDGPWPRAGAVEARGVLAYDARCLCHVFHADAVRPWTP